MDDAADGDVERKMKAEMGGVERFGIGCAYPDSSGDWEWRAEGVRLSPPPLHAHPINPLF